MIHMVVVVVVEIIKICVLTHSSESGRSAGVVAQPGYLLKTGLYVSTLTGYRWARVVQRCREVYFVLFVFKIALRRGLYSMHSISEGYIGTTGEPFLRFLSP